MQIQNIFSSWGTAVTTTHEEFMSDSMFQWDTLLAQRNLILIKGFNANLTDEEYFNFGKKFGRVWTMDDYRQPKNGGGAANTIPPETQDNPVSYFKADNNAFRKRMMGYHADMAHIGDKSYPSRALYMTRNTKDGSGITSWLNLESAWEQCTAEEKARYDNVEIVNHTMYQPGQNIEVLPFLKTNPKTGKISPRLNALTRPDGYRGKGFGWINHIKRDGKALDWETSRELLFDAIELMEQKSNAIYDHHWDEGDIIIYNNWFNIHKRSQVNDNDVPEGRLLRRLTIDF